MVAARVFDGTIRVWNVETAALLATFDQKPTSVNKLLWSPQGQTLASCRGTYAVRLWDMLERSAHYLQGGIGSIESMAWSPDGTLLAVGGSENTQIQYWNVKTKEIFETINLQAGILDLAWFPEGESIAIVSRDAVYIRSTSGATLRRALPVGFPLNSLKWSPNGKILASVMSYGVRLWHLDDGEIGVLETSSPNVTSTSFSADGALLASICRNGTVELWACDGWRKISTFQADPSWNDQRDTIAFSVTAPVLATVGAQGTTINIWGLKVDALLGKVREVSTALYTTAKVALVGRSAVGKTVLGWRLVHEEFKEHPSTHGQHFWLFDSLKYVRPDGTHCDVILWDLAGQPDYRITHVLFLDDVDLALILFDSADQKEPLKDVEYWLKQLPSGCRRILVGSKADRGYASVSNEELAEFCQYHQITGGFVVTSALTGENVLELSGRIKSEIDSIKLEASIATESFNRIKTFVLGLKEEVHYEDPGSINRSGLIVSMAELGQRLGERNSSSQYGADEIEAAVRHLERHGFIKRITTSSGREVLLLVPELLNNLAASLILEARRNERGLGAIDETAVLRGEFAFPELNLLGADEKEIMLDATVGLLIEKNVCFRATIGNTTLLIFPALINQKRPVLSTGEKTTETTTFVATGAVENVYPGLVVLLGYTNTFTRTHQWQNQAQYEIEPGAVCGFRLVEENEGEIQLVLYFAKRVPPYERLLFEGLFEKFLQRPRLDVRKYPPVKCEDCKKLLPRVLVVEYMSKAQESVFCPKCGNSVCITRLTTDLQPGLVQKLQFEERRETQLTRLKTVFETALVRVKRYRLAQGTLYRNPTCFLSYAWGNNRVERWVTHLAEDLKDNQIDVLLDRWHNAEAGTPIGSFLDRIETCDFVIVVGTPHYKEKRHDNQGILSREIDTIEGVMLETRAHQPKIVPLLCEGEKNESFPGLLLGLVHIDFRDPDLYFANMLDLLLNLHGIPTAEPSFADDRERLRNVRQATRETSLSP